MQKSNTKKINNIYQISHCCFSCIDLKQTVRFYKNVLGIRVIHKFIASNKKTYGVCFLVGNGTFLEFFEQKEILSAKSQFRHICLSVKSLDRMFIKLKKTGLNLSIKRGKTDNTKLAWIKDPNGIVIEFHEYDKLSKFFKYQ